MSFTSIMQKNPFTDYPVPLTPSRGPPSAWRIPGEYLNGQTVPPLPSSRSAPDFTAMTPQHSPKPDGLLPSHLNKTALRPDPLKLHNSKDVGSRGRVAHQFSTPPRGSATGDNKAGKETAPAQEGSARRSRSPVKRLFGFGKSSSPKNMNQESQLEAKHVTPESNKKAGSLRTWGHRLRHGFLVSSLVYKFRLD